MSMPLRVFIVAAAALACGVASVSAQSLGDVAKKEEQRRKAVKTTGKVYTNKDLKPPLIKATPTATPPSSGSGTTAGPGGAEPAAATKAPDQPAPQDPRQTEQYWRDQMNAARSALQREEMFLEALQSRINALSTDFVNRDDPAQKAVAANDRQKAIDEQDRVKANIADLKQQIADIEEEARQAGVPPGWLR